MEEEEEEEVEKLNEEEWKAKNCRVSIFNYYSLSIKCECGFLLKLWCYVEWQEVVVLFFDVKITQ